MQEVVIEYRAVYRCLSECSRSKFMLYYLRGIGRLSIAPAADLLATSQTIDHQILKLRFSHFCKSKHFTKSSASADSSLLFWSVSW